MDSCRTPFAGEDGDAFSMPLRVGPGKTTLGRKGKEERTVRLGNNPRPSQAREGIWVSCVEQHPAHVSVTDPWVKVIT